jgi:hypothetical protein
MKKIWMMVIVLVFLFGCAGVPVRPALKEEISVLPGKIDGNQFTGIRYPFKVSVPPHWKMATEFPDFMVELGYDRPDPTDKEQTELYAYNPGTKSNVNFDFTPAGRYATFSQEKIEWMTTAAADSLKSELDKEFGQGAVKPDVAPTEPISLKGVQFAAKKYVTYTVKGQKREQGWIFGFTEPYQLFILYMILEIPGTSDREDLKKILDSFEFVPKK